LKVNLEKIMDALPEGAEFKIKGIKLTNTKTGKTEILNIEED